ncbi:MAG: response regulator, partial [Myxococcales bacterium]
MGLARILVADPDSRSLALTVTGLHNAGFDVLSTSRGEEALALLQSLPAAIFCEVGLEGVDGFALCEAAHKAPATKDVPFFLMSRRDQSGYRERARAAGALDYLTKPLYLRDVCTLARLFASFKADSPLIREDLGSTPLFYVIRALTSGSLSGTVEVPHEEGVVHFRDGRVIEAVAGELKGEAAIGKLLMLAQGELTLRLGPVLVRGSMSYSLRDLISHDEPRRRRFERAVESMGGHEARLTIHFPTLARELPRLPPSVERIVRLFDGKRALGDVLRACDFDEVTAAETILRLFAMRVIRPAAELLSGPTTELPRLFEPRPDEAILAMKDLFPDAAPLPTEDVREGVPREVSDWLADLGKGTFQDILAVGTGGWLELPASQAGQQLREAIGELSDAEIENPLDALGALGSDAPPLDSAAAASEAESVAPDSIAAAVAGAPQDEADDKATAIATPSTPETAEPAQASAVPPGEERDSPKASAEEPKPAILDASATASREASDEGAPSPSGIESAQSNTDQQPAAAQGDEDAKGSASEPSTSFGPSEHSPDKQPAPGAAGLAQDLAAFCLEKLSGQVTGPAGAGTATAPGREAGGGAESPAAAAPAAEEVTALAAPAEPRSGEMGGTREQPSAIGAASGDAAQINAGADPANADAPEEEAFFNSEPGFDEPGPPRPPRAMRVVLVFAALAFALVAVLLIVTPSKRRLPQGGPPLGLDPTSPTPAVATPAPDPSEPAALPGASAQQAAPDEGAAA